MLRNFLLLLWTAAALSAAPRVVLISIDGLRGTTLASLASRGLKTPNLNELASSGQVAAGLTGVIPTVTYPSHTTLVTGRFPADHGIHGNVIFDPEKKMNGAWHWYSVEIKVPTLWDLARARGLKTGAVSWPVSVGAAIDYNFPEYRTPKTMEDRLLAQSLSTAGLFAEYEKANGEFALGPADDRDRAKQAAHILKTRKPELMLVHLFDMDHEEHLHGPDSREAFHALEEIDASIGLLRAAVREAGVEAETTWVITSDHGFFPVEKSLHPHAILNSLGLAGTDRRPDQWRVAADSHGGCFALRAAKPGDHEAIELATRAFERLQKDGIWGIDRVFTAADLAREKAFPGAFLAVSMGSGFTAGSAVSGPWVTSSGNTKGTHGYAPGPAELDASLLIAGPGVKPGKLPRGRLVDVAPTVARILGLPLEGAEGHSVLP